MKKFKNSIALCMIVKNESHIIESTLENVTSKMDIDYYVISDTGSTDNTKEIITEFFKRKNIPGEMHDDEWKDFGHNRSKVLEYAFSCPSRFLFVHDADDKIEGTLNLPDLEKEVNPKNPTQFSMRIGKDFTYNRPLIFDNNFKWCFKGVLHEFASLLNASEGPAYSYILNNSDYYIDSRREGSRSMDPEKYHKDAIILEKAYHDEPVEGDSLKSRYAFYCAQSYKDCRNIEKSLEYYLIRTRLGNYQEEVYLSYMHAGQCMIALDRPEEEIETIFTQGYLSMKDRSECLFYLALYLRSKNKFLKAYMYAKMGCEISFPNHRFLFLEKDIFEKKIFDECAISAFYIEKYDECFKLNIKLMQKFSDPRYISNMNFCVQPLKEIAIRKVNYNFIKPKSRHYGVTLTMATSKNYELFEQTVNSMLNNIEDLYMIERFICIDDNSSKEDRLKMLNNYPFFEFTFKRKDQEGQVFSLNALQKKLTAEDKYIFQMQEDWIFLTKKNYIGDTIRILKDNPSIGQVFFNRNYAKNVDDYKIEGGKAFNDHAYTIHEFVKDVSKRKNPASAEDWPHFKLQPSLVKREVYEKVGKFEIFTNYELDYAKRYTNIGYLSAFHNRIDLVHIEKTK